MPSVWALCVLALVLDSVFGVFILYPLSLLMASSPGSVDTNPAHVNHMEERPVLYHRPPL